MSGVIEVGYSASINTPDYVLEEDKSNNIIQITARDDGTSGLCILTQNESGNKINLHLTTPEEKEYWEISKCCLGPASIRMVMLLVLTTIYQVIHTLQQKQLDWVPILLQKFQLPLLAVILLYSPVGLTPLKNIH